ncbi:ATP synthase subunit I [Roseateles violae]|uniref:ATP synthase subunit I n=1 Tax=Roseateles violae TaxID=3058042 RepID=A0ABT8DRQ5_9BURK|nr:ATP synthase subunit I [Pelomonas sp. PFR6]MDN3919609.1 ATP synthase subunit I [Pelomonas sp. PFR6]
MTHSASDGPIKAQRPAGAGLDWEDEVAEPPFKVLTREEAQALRVRQGELLSPWRLVALQAVVGGVIALVWWLATGSGGKAGSALCGAAAVVMPNALMAWGMARVLGTAPSAAVLGFMFWELIKIMLAVAILAAAAKWMPDLSWPALLVALIGCLKVNWLALLWRGRKKRDGH